MGWKTGKMVGLAAILAMAIPLSQPITAIGIEISSLSDLYEPVDFDHDMHIETLEENCTACHHHAAGTPAEGPRCITCHADSGEADSPVCSSCHAVEPFSAANLEKNQNTPNIYHRVKPGLKAAYHQNCVTCHQDMGAPTGCQECHALTDKGEKYYNTGKYAPAPSASAGHGSGH